MDTDDDEYLKELSRAVQVHYAKLRSHQELIDQHYKINMSTAVLAQANKESLEQQGSRISTMSKNFTQDTAELRKETKAMREKLNNEVKVLNNHVSTIDRGSSTLDTRITDIANEIKKNNPEALSRNIKQLQNDLKNNMENANKRFGAMEESQDSVINRKEP